MNRLGAAALLISATLMVSAPATRAQNTAAQQVSCVTLQVVRNSDGSQSVITPKGDLAILPGAGVAGNVAEIYFGSQGGFWYTDRSGQTIDLSPTVQALQARRAQLQHAAQIPQYAPEPVYQQPVQQQPAQQQESSNSSSSGSGAMAALGTAAAAGVGAMAGAAMSNHYYNAPYGTPMYYGPNGHPYYYNNGNRRELDEINLNQNQKAVIYNKRQIDKQNQQQAAQHIQANRQAQAQPRAEHDFQRQQQWYSEQMRQNPHKFQQSGSNPFVAQHSNRGSRGERASRGGGGRSRGGGGRRR